MFNCIDIYSFFVSVCVGTGPGALLCPEGGEGVAILLLRRPWFMQVKLTKISYIGTDLFTVRLILDFDLFGVQFNRLSLYIQGKRSFQISI